MLTFSLYQFPGNIVYTLLKLCAKEYGGVSRKDVGDKEGGVVDFCLHQKRPLGSLQGWLS